jgi:hypothetical protein
MEREPYLAAGEGDDERADIKSKKKKGWGKFFKKIDKEISDDGSREKPSRD